MKKEKRLHGSAEKELKKKLKSVDSSRQKLLHRLYKKGKKGDLLW